MDLILRLNNIFGFLYEKKTENLEVAQKNLKLEVKNSGKENYELERI